jgi:anti-sigma regulatory factor (Ser/Thr protein kinase)
MDKTFTSYQIEERSYVAYIKREIHQQVVKKQFKDSKVAAIDIVVSEICSNLVKHAGSGELLYRVTDINEDDRKFEIISLDKGPGIIDKIGMMKDGVSTTKTLGQGLGAIHRLSDEVELYTLVGAGTILYSSVRSEVEKNLPTRKRMFEWSDLFISKPREEVCGDGYRIKETLSGIKLFFGDGLGHGEYAKEAVELAGEFFSTLEDDDPVEIIRQMHEKVRRTRGLVGTIAVFNRQTNEWRICGVGNIFTRLYTGLNYKNYLPYNGTIGQNLPNSMSPSILPAERNQRLIMCSDGLQTRWDLAKYPAILKYNTMILAAAIYRDFTRGNDDSSILILNVK